MIFFSGNYKNLFHFKEVLETNVLKNKTFSHGNFRFHLWVTYNNDYFYTHHPILKKKKNLFNRHINYYHIS